MLPSISADGSLAAVFCSTSRKYETFVKTIDFGVLRAYGLGSNLYSICRHRSVFSHDLRSKIVIDFVLRYSQNISLSITAENPKQIFGNSAMSSTLDHFPK